MIKKPFDPKLYAENDRIAKEMVANLLATLGKCYEVVENEKKRKVDLLVFKNGKHQFYAEVEIKKVWSGPDFPYQSVNFPERKLKYTELDKPTLYIMFNSDQTSYLCVTSDDLANSPINIVPNKYVRFGERFIQVDKAKVLFNNIKKSVKMLQKE